MEEVREQLLIRTETITPASLAKDYDWVDNYVHVNYWSVQGTFNAKQNS